MSMSPPDPGPSTPEFGTSAAATGDATPPSASRDGSRRPALAVAVLAAVVVITMFIQQMLSFASGASEAMAYLDQAFHLVRLPAGFLCTAAVIWLLQASGTGERRLAVLPLIAFGLVVLSGLLEPARMALGGLVTVLRPDAASPMSNGVSAALIATVFTAAQVLLAIAIGVLAIMILVRPGSTQRTVRIPVTPMVLALVLLVAAVLSVVLVPLTGIVNSTGDGAGTLGLLLPAVISALKGFLEALLVPAAGLLIALAPGRPRRLAWVALGLHWLSWIGAVLTIRIMVFLIMSNPLSMSIARWVLLSSIIGVLGGIAVAVVAVVILMQLRRSDADSARREHAPRGAAPRAIY